MMQHMTFYWNRKFTYSTLMVWIVLAMCCMFIFQAAPVAAQTNGTTHTVQVGENLFRIALKYGFTTDYLAAVNNITDSRRIYVGQVLYIPDPAAPEAAPVVTSPETLPESPVAPVATVSGHHVVQRGETLASIGRAYGVGWPDIVTANRLVNANHIYAGQQLIIPGATGSAVADLAPVNAVAEPVAQTAATGSERTHVVRAGEHLASIARAYSLSWPTIARANNITDPNHIFSGQRLIIPATDDNQGVYVQGQAWTPAAPAATITTGKQVIVDLSDQRVYFYENGQLVRNVLVSTGLSVYPTVQGNYKIYLKYASQTMSGPGYSLPNVPYVLYFYKGYSLHGTYWHSNWGTPMSHGCVNMPIPEAEWLYNWAPIGTPVRVQW